MAFVERKKEVGENLLLLAVDYGWLLADFSSYYGRALQVQYCGHMRAFQSETGAYL
jgi:hypothetical protein